MNYQCEYCKYETLYKCNYDRHLQTQTHINILLSLKEQNIIGKSNDKIIDILKTQVVEKDKQMEEKDKLIHELAELLKQHGIPTTTNTNSHNTNNISVTAYVNAYFADAPPIKKLTKRDLQRIEKDCEKEYDDTMVKVIVDLYKKNKLIPFISDIIVKYYKKEDVTKQSLWTSDASRLTYIVREIIEKCGVTTWTKDLNGEKIRKYTIVPILEVIKEKLYKYRGEVINKRKLVDNLMDGLEEFLDTCKVVSELLEMCDNRELENQIIKTMTPYFSLNLICYNKPEQPLKRLTDGNEMETIQDVEMETYDMPKKTLIICNYCSREFKNRSNLQRHETACRKK
jgi:hypothetical protein